MDSTLLKGLTILERVVAADSPSSISTLARELGLPKSNVHRTLSSLREAGYLLYNSAERTYYPSLKIVQMGQRVSATFPFKAAVNPHLEMLAERTGESAHFAVREGDSVIFLASVVPRGPLASVMPEGLRLHWTDTAFGIAVMAATSEDEAPDLSGIAHVASMVHRAALEGYALEPNHGERHTFELAVAIRTQWGGVLGVIGISGPSRRLTDAALVRYIDDVQVAAKAAGDALAHLKGALQARRDG